MWYKPWNKTQEKRKEVEKALDVHKESAVRLKVAIGQVPRKAVKNGVCTLFQSTQGSQGISLSRGS